MWVQKLCRANAAKEKKARHVKMRSCLKKYGITPDDYDRMLDEQVWKCAICNRRPEEKEKRLAVDHCHKTGIVRQLLCGGCNLMLGCAKDNPATLRKAADYVEKWVAKHAEIKPTP